METSSQHLGIIATFWSNLMDSWGEWPLYIISSNLVLFGSFWAVVLFYLVCDKYRLWQKYKIQKGKYPSAEQMKKGLKLVLFNHLCIQFPLLILSYGLFKAVGIRFEAEEIGPWYMIALQLMVFMLVEDTLFYWSHRLLHWPKIYKHIHKIHHQFRTPCALASEYAHPLEFFLSNSLPTMAGPVLLALLGVEVHFLTLLAWLFYRVLETADGHSGYEFPWWFPHKLIYGGGASIHDFHHSHNRGNFASFFTHWDRWCGTNLAFEDFKAKMGQEKAKTRENTKSKSSPLNQH